MPEKFVGFLEDLKLSDLNFCWFRGYKQHWDPCLPIFHSYYFVYSWSEIPSLLIDWLNWIEFECHIVKEHFQQLCFFVFFPLHRRPRGALTASRGFTRWMITPIGDLSSKSCSASWRRRAPPSHSVQPYRKILSISFVYTCTQRNGADIWRLVIFKTAKWHGMPTVVGLHGARSTGRMFFDPKQLVLAETLL